jgi:hypothetical protein
MMGVRQKYLLSITMIGHAIKILEGVQKASFQEIHYLQHAYNQM